MDRQRQNAFYNARRWRKISKAYALTQHNLCEQCLKHGKVRPYDIVHHKKHLNELTMNDYEIAYGFNNLMCVCIECHNAIHNNIKEVVREGLTFNSNGDLIEAIHTPLIK